MLLLDYLSSGRLAALDIQQAFIHPMIALFRTGAVRRHEPLCMNCQVSSIRFCKGWRRDLDFCILGLNWRRIPVISFQCALPIWLEVVMRPRLQFLSIGPAVSDLQNLLNNALVQALPKLVVDGKFGEKTLQRVRMYQQSRGLSVDGVVGRMTWAALDGKAPPKPGATVHPPAVGAKPKGIWSGSPIKCTFGSGKSSLKIPGAARPACIGDCKQYVNIPTFGFCTSMANPVVSSATMAAQASQPYSSKAGAGQIVPGPCMPVIASGWTPAAQWELVENLPSIDKNSILMCMWGGLISIG